MMFYGFDLNKKQPYVWPEMTMSTDRANCFPWEQCFSIVWDTRVSGGTRCRFCGDTYNQYTLS